MKSWVVHYKNKYPGAKVVASENALDVFRGDEHVVALRKDGAGMWSDVSEEHGCTGKHCLAPIPKDARVHKIVDGKIALAEEHEHRSKARDQFVENGMVQSVYDLSKKGFEFDEKQRLIKSGK